MTILRNTSISPDDLLDAAKTIPLGEICTCNWLAQWVSPATSGEWAQRGLKEADAYGLSNAISYAKRSAACRIDVLIRYNHLTRLIRVNYPSKIDGLRKVGLEIPDVVQELVIDPRNELEHGYELPNGDVARHAVGVSELFLRATEAEYERSSTIAVGWNAAGSHGFANGREYVQFREFINRPMLFIDVFDNPPTAKIVDPVNQEVRSVALQSFTEDQAIRLAQLLRSNYLYSGSRSITGRGPTYYQEMKRQAGF